MKLAAIYNVWDGTELLEGSVNCIKDHVDEIIFVYQDHSNFGEYYNPWDDFNPSSIPKRTMYLYQPCLTINGTRNETEKRNIGLQIAKEKGCTHFLHLDCDEYYLNFGEAKEFYINADHRGSVCSLYTYFKKPTLRFKELDNYFVPFIHVLDKHTTAGAWDYPFRVDPTRRINEKEVIHLPVVMHHFSWVRKDINRKVRNSSARGNIQKGTWRDSYCQAKPELFVSDFNQSLVEVENLFHIKDF